MMAATKSMMVATKWFYYTPLSLPHSQLHRGSRQLQCQIQMFGRVVAAKAEGIHDAQAGT